MMFSMKPELMPPNTMPVRPSSPTMPNHISVPMLRSGTYLRDGLPAPMNAAPSANPMSATVEMYQAQMNASSPAARTNSCSLGF